MSNQIKTYHADVWIRSNGAGKVHSPERARAIFSEPFKRIPSKAIYVLLRHLIQQSLINIRQ